MGQSCTCPIYEVSTVECDKVVPAPPPEEFAGVNDLHFPQLQGNPSTDQESSPDSVQGTSWKQSPDETNNYPEGPRSCTVSAATVQEEKEAAVEQARCVWEKENRAKTIIEKKKTLYTTIEATRAAMRASHSYEHRPANRYGETATLPVFESGKHVPILGLINPTSGAMAGDDILGVCRTQPYYRDRMFNIVDVVRGQTRGGLLDVFRIELTAAREEAKRLFTRPRIISGGGDGTGTFALFIIFLALKADPERAEEGLADTGNGFIWTDQELAEYFPAIAQMPLGSANDFANILGWGQKYPGAKPVSMLYSQRWSARMLSQWFSAIISPDSKIANFDLWGIMPKKGDDKCDFRLAELTGTKGRCPNKKADGKRHIHLKEAGKPAPFCICLYFSAGFGAYMTARFQLNRHKTPTRNRIEYVQQAVAQIIESTPPQLQLRLNGVKIKCDNEHYFPPRQPEKGTQGRGYREVGFYNINWQAHAMHGADRAPLGKRLFSKRTPVTFNDGKLDMFRWKLTSVMKNPGTRVQTDKKQEMELQYQGEKGQGLFFQWDGEARFAFNPEGNPFHICVRRVMVIPVVIGFACDEKLTGDLDNGEPVAFRFCGSAEEQEQVKKRVLKSCNGELDLELNATVREIIGTGFRMHTSVVETEPESAESSG